MDGWRLRAAREWYGVGLPEFAKYLGVSEARYRNWEQEGERFRAPNDLATIVRLAEVLGVTEGWLMGRPTAARWNEDVHGLRQFLRRELAARTDLAGLSDAPRVAAVMAAVGRYRNDWAPAEFGWGLCGVDRKTFDRILAGQTPVTDTVLARLDEFTLLGDWLVTGDPADLTAAGVGPYEDDALALIRARVPPGFIKQKIPILAVWYREEPK